MSAIADPPVAAPAAPPATPPPVPPVAAPAPPSGVSEPWAKEWIGPDFSLNHKALERLPEHLKGLRPTLERQKNFEDVLTTMQNQQFLVGKKALAPLPADAPKEAVTERKALLDAINGVPASPKEYGIQKPADLPDVYWVPKLAEGFSTWAHKHSISPAAVREVVELQLGNVKEQLAAQGQYETQYWANEEKTFAGILRQENIPADRANALVEKGAVALGLDLNNEKTKTFLKGADARLMAMRHAIYTGEDRVVAPATGGSGAGGNPTELAQDARSNPANPLYGPYWNRDGKYSRSAQEAAVERVNEWLKAASAATSVVTDRRRR